MKNICILLLITLLSISFTTSIKRTENKIESQVSPKKIVSPDGGTLDTGFTCEKGIHVNGKIVGMGTFYPKRIEHPSTDCDKLGVVFKLTKEPNATGKMVFIKCLNTPDQFYIPFKNINSKAIYTNPFGSNKFIEFKVTTDGGHSFSLKVYLPYKFIGYYVSDEQGNKICALLNTRSADTQAKITNAKNTASKHASEFCANDKLLKSISGGAADRSKYKAKVSADIGKLDKSIKTKQVELLKYDSEISKIQAQLIAVQLKRDNCIKTITAFGNQKEAHKKALLKSEEKGTSLEIQKANTKKLISDSVAALTVQMNLLKAEVPPKKAVFDKALKTVTHDKNCLAFEAELSAIHP